MRVLIKDLGRSSNTNKGTMDLQQVKRVLISRPNHRLGNLLLITPLVQEVQTLFPNATIDVFIKGNLGPIVFENFTNVNQIIRLPKKHFDELGNYVKGWLKLKKNKYDLAINADKKSSSGRLSIQLVDAKFKCFGEQVTDLSNQFSDYAHIAKYPVYDLRHFLASVGMNVSNTPIPNLLLQLSPEEVAKGKALWMPLFQHLKKRFVFSLLPREPNVTRWNGGPFFMKEF